MCHDVSSEWNTLEDVFLKTENQKTGKMRHLKCSTNKKSTPSHTWLLFLSNINFEDLPQNNDGLFKIGYRFTLTSFNQSYSLKLVLLCVHLKQTFNKSFLTFWSSWVKLQTLEFKKRSRPPKSCFRKVANLKSANHGRRGWTLL